MDDLPCAVQVLETKKTTTDNLANLTLAQAVAIPQKGSNGTAVAVLHHNLGHYAIREPLTQNSLVCLTTSKYRTMNFDLHSLRILDSFITSSGVAIIFVFLTATNSLDVLSSARKTSPKPLSIHQTFPGIPFTQFASELKLTRQVSTHSRLQPATKESERNGVVYLFCFSSPFIWFCSSQFRHLEKGNGKRALSCPNIQRRNNHRVLNLFMVERFQSIGVGMMKKWLVGHSRNADAPTARERTPTTNAGYIERRESM